MADQVVGGDPQVAVPADRQARPGRHRHQREQPRPVRQLQRQPRRAAVEAPLPDPGPGRRGAQHLLQLLVGGGDRLDPFPAAVGVADPDLVAAVGVDVLDRGIVEQPLEPVQAEQGVEDRPGQLVLLGRRQHSLRVRARPRWLGAPTPRRSTGAPAPARPPRPVAAGPPRPAPALALGQHGEDLGTQPGHQARCRRSPGHLLGGAPVRRGHSLRSATAAHGPQHPSPPRSAGSTARPRACRSAGAERSPLSSVARRSASVRAARTSGASRAPGPMPAPTPTPRRRRGPRAGAPAPRSRARRRSRASG